MRPPKVRKLLTILTAFCLLLGMAASASAYPGLTPGIYENEQLLMSINPSEIVVGELYTVKDITFKLTAIDNDPSITWALSAVNMSSSASSYFMVWPAIQTSGYSGQGIIVDSSVGITLSGTPGTATVSPDPARVGVFDYISTNLTGVWVPPDGDTLGYFDPTGGNAWGVGTTFSATIPTNGSITQSPAQSLPATYAAGTTNEWFTEVTAFQLSPGAAVGLSGYCHFVAVPIPPTALLMGSGLLGLALLRWRRKRLS